MYTMAKISTTVAQPVFMIGTRTLLGGVISLLVYFIFFYSSDEINSLSKKEWTLILLVGFFNMYLCNAAEAWGLQYLPASKAAFFYNLEPFFAALFSYFLFCEYMSWQKWLGLCVGFVGFLPILLGPSHIIDTSAQFGFSTLANFSLLAASLLSVSSWIMVRALVRKRNISPFLINGVCMVFGSLFCFLHAFLDKSEPYVTSGHMKEFLQIAIIMAVFKYAIAYNLNTHLLKKNTTTSVVFFGFTATLFAKGIGILFFNGQLSFNFILSIILVFIGLLIFNYEELKQDYNIK